MSSSIFAITRCQLLSVLPLFFWSRTVLMVHDWLQLSKRSTISFWHFCVFPIQRAPSIPKLLSLLEPRLNFASTSLWFFCFEGSPWSQGLRAWPAGQRHLQCHHLCGGHWPWHHHRYQHPVQNLRAVMGEVSWWGVVPPSGGQTWDCVTFSGADFKPAPAQWQWHVTHSILCY